MLDQNRSISMRLFHAQAVHDLNRRVKYFLRRRLDLPNEPFTWTSFCADALRPRREGGEKY